MSSGLAELGMDVMGLVVVGNDPKRIKKAKK